MKHQTTLIRELLKIPTALLAKRIETQLVKNPALERVFATEAEQTFVEDDYGSGEIDSISDVQSLYETLSSQLKTSSLGISLRQMNILELLIGSLDENGYLRRENFKLLGDLKFKGIDCDGPELEQLVQKLQNFRPSGIAARSVQECLSIQMRHKINRSPENGLYQLCSQVLERSFVELSKKHFNKICQRHKIDENTLHEVIREITKLNPKPGAVQGRFTSLPVPLVDLNFRELNSEVECNVSNVRIPKLQVSPSYLKMMKHFQGASRKTAEQKKALKFVHRRISEAQKFIEALERREVILGKVAIALANFQKDYFLTGDERKIKTMRLQNLAEVTEFDIATLSRVLQDKLMKTEYGFFPVKKLFVESLKTASGNTVSTAEVRNILQEIIDNENKDKPLPDDKLQQMLKDRGFKLSRRTVLNYRNMMNIPVARLRKRVKPKNKKDSLIT